MFLYKLSVQFLWRKCHQQRRPKCVILCRETSAVISACLGARNCRQAKLFLLGNADQLLPRTPPLSMLARPEQRELGSFQFNTVFEDCLCGLVVRVPGYRSRGPGSIPGTAVFFWEVVGLERGPLSLVITIEELLERNSTGSGLENREYCRVDPLRWPRDTLYPQKLATNFADKRRSLGRYSSLAD
jgi:hypothetical protein